MEQGFIDRKSKQKESDNKDAAKDCTMDGCLSMETLYTPLPPPRSRERRSLTCGMLFQLSPRAGLQIPPSPPTV